MILGSNYFYRDLLKRIQVLGGAERVGDSCESTYLLCPARETNSRIAKKARVLSRGHDFVRVFRTALATNRGRSPDHCFYPSSHLRCFPNFGGASSSRIGSRNLGTNVRCPRCGWRFGLTTRCGSCGLPRTVTSLQTGQN